MADVDRYEMGRAVWRVFHYFQSLGHQVTILSRQKPPSGFDDDVCGAVKIVPRGRMAEYLRPLTHVIAFDLSRVKFVRKHIRKKEAMLVPLWSRIFSQNTEDLNQFSRIFCPNQESYQNLIDHTPRLDGHISSMPEWDQGAPIVSGGSTLPPENSVFLVVDKPTDTGQAIRSLELAEALLKRGPCDKVTLSVRKSSWPRWLSVNVRNLVREFDGQLIVAAEESYMGYLQQMSSHRLVCCCGNQSDLSVTESEALSLGKPYIATEDYVGDLDELHDKCIRSLVKLSQSNHAAISIRSSELFTYRRDFERVLYHTLIT